MRLHDLRHSFASFAAAQGALLLMIGKLLGHTQAQTTQRYAHLVADPVRHVAETVGARPASSLAPRPMNNVGAVTLMWGGDQSDHALPSRQRKAAQIM
jgi:hypothetical protein